MALDLLYLDFFLTAFRPLDDPPDGEKLEDFISHWIPLGEVDYKQVAQGFQDGLYRNYSSFLDMITGKLFPRATYSKRLGENLGKHVFDTDRAGAIQLISYVSQGNYEHVAEWLLGNPGTFDIATYVKRELSKTHSNYLEIIGTAAAAYILDVERTHLNPEIAGISEQLQLDALVERMDSVVSREILNEIAYGHIRSLQSSTFDLSF